MFKNVLVGVDGRSSGHDAIALASRFIDADGRLTLAHVHGGELRPTHAATPGLIRGEREASRRLLEEERAAVGVDAKLISIAGMSPGRALHVQAEQQTADLLAVGSCARGIVGRAMLGNDTRAALNGAPCAVAIASRGYAEHPRPIAKIGVAYNGSPESEHALAVARELAQPTRAALYALEVVTVPTYAYTGLMPAALGQSVELMLEEANERMKGLPGVAGRAVYGLAGEELAAFSDELDVLVVGSRGYGPLRRLMLGSTSDYLERHARCSLLVLPRAAAVVGGESRNESSAETVSASSA